MTSGSMTIERTIRCFAAGLALIATACAPSSYWDAGGDFESGMGEFRYAGADRDFRTRVVGNPFKVPPAVTERAVIAAMRGQDKGMNTNFTTTPRNNVYRRYHIVMLFNPTRTGSAACETPERYAGTGRQGEVSLAALLCNGDRLVYGVGGTMSGVKQPGDSRFNSLIYNLMNYFVPYESMIEDDPDDDDDGS